MNLLVKDTRLVDDVIPNTIERSVTMDKWSIDLGIVPVWDEEEVSYESASLKISYDGTQYFPFSLEADFVDSRSKTRSTGKEFVIECKETGETVINDDFNCVLTAEQKEVLLEVQGKWQYNPINPPEPDLGSRIAGKFAKDFGIVFYYDAENEQFVTANLKIDFDWNCANPIITLLRIYDDDRYPKTQTNGQYKSFTFNYEGVINGMSHYVVCGNHYLLSKSQIDLLEYIEKQLNK